MKIEVKGGTLPKEEIDFYIEQLKRDNPDKTIKSVAIDVKDDNVEIEFTYDSKPFHRIRRITGYLVGDISRFNDAKRAEVTDRVKHSITKSSE